MARRRVKLTFPQEIITRPVIYELGHRFNVVTNIRKADVTETQGWVLLELEGDDDEIDRSLQWALDIGVDVGPVEGDVIAG